MTRLGWILWIAGTLMFTGLLAVLITDNQADRRVFLPGATSSGHHQIELACGACHTDEFADAEAIQASCENCHADALKAAKDDHPKSKFTDPRNADRIAVLDARYCATCHVEHRPEITGEMGLTVPEDFCVLCHAEIAEERPSHTGMGFETCASSGCHNFHDNRAIYEDFLAKHLDAESTRHHVALATTNFIEIAEFLDHYPKDFPVKAVNVPDWQIPDNPDHAKASADWHESSHAQAGVNCSACHQSETKGWVQNPGFESCERCHVDEVAGFLTGKHGMRLATDTLGLNLDPMSPALARLPMHTDALSRTLSCQSCHAQHRYDVQSAQVEACLGCHADEHSMAYQDSPHAVLWQAEMNGDAAPGTGVSCATCHMPRVDKDYMWGAFTHNLVQHNQSNTLRPNEKMIRPVCMSCHGLGFAINALADRNLIDRNFNGQPQIHVESMDLVKKRL